MATHTTLSNLFSDIADAIRAKTGGSATIVADNFPTAITAIPTGGGGVYQEKTVTPSAAEQQITADAGYDALSKVTVAGVPIATISITGNGSYYPQAPTVGFDEVEVDVQPTLQSKTATPTASEQTISPDTGYDALSAVTINATPLEAKTVTPSAQEQVVSPTAPNIGLSSVTVSGDADLTAENIKKDVSVFGVVGTFEGGGSSANTYSDAYGLTFMRDLETDYGQVLPETYVVDLPNMRRADNMFGSPSGYTFTVRGTKYLTVNGSSEVGRCKTVYSMFGRAAADSGFYGVGFPLTTLTLNFDMSGVTDWRYMFYVDSRKYLTTINGTFNFSSAVNLETNSFNGLTAVQNMTFAANTLSLSISFAQNPAFSTTSLISLANCLVSGLATAQTLQLHATAKTNCEAIYVLNDSGTAVLSTSGTTGAMTLTSFITSIKGWTIA